METEIKIEKWSAISELVRMSIGTDKGSWWADPSFGSELWILRKEGKVDNRTADRVRQMILDCLNWIKEDRVASDIFCQTKQVGKNQIEYIVTVKKPNEKPIIVKDVWNAIE